MSIIFIYIIHHIILSLGLASSLIIDIFIIVVEKTKQIRSIEKSFMSRVMSYSFISSFLLFLTQLAYVCFIFLNQTEFNNNTYIFSFVTFLLSAVLVFCTATQKYYQFKILIRHQEQYHHLSDSFIRHHKEFKQTSVIIFTLWLALYIAYILV